MYLQHHQSHLERSHWSASWNTKHSKDLFVSVCVKLGWWRRQSGGLSLVTVSPGWQRQGRTVLTPHQNAFLSMQAQETGKDRSLWPTFSLPLTLLHFLHSFCHHGNTVYLSIVRKPPIKYKLYESFLNFCCTSSSYNAWHVVGTPKIGLNDWSTLIWPPNHYAIT